MYVLYPLDFLTAPAQSSTSGSAFILPPNFLHNSSDKMDSFASWRILFLEFRVCRKIRRSIVDKYLHRKVIENFLFFTQAVTKFLYPWIMNLGLFRVHCLSQIPQCWSNVGFPNSAGIFLLRFLFRSEDLFVLFELFFFRLRFLRFLPQNPISPLFAPRTHVPHL